MSIAAIVALYAVWLGSGLAAAAPQNDPRLGVLGSTDHRVPVMPRMAASQGGMVSGMVVSFGGDDRDDRVRRAICFSIALQPMIRRSMTEHAVIC